MATIREEVLDAALQDGLVTGTLTQNQRIYLNSSIIRINDILALFIATKEATLEDISSKIDLNTNTLTQYLRYLEKYKFIQVARHEVEGVDGRLLVSLYRINGER